MMTQATVTKLGDNEYRVVTNEFMSDGTYLKGLMELKENKLECKPGYLCLYFFSITLGPNSMKKLNTLRLNETINLF